MIWYGLPPGQIKTLRRMMLHPLDFDPVDYIEKTLFESDTQPSEETITLANEFNRLREKLLPSVGQIYFDISNTARFTLESISKKPKPLDYTLLNSIFSAPLKAALSIKACDSINIQIDKISDSFEVNEHHGTEPNENLYEVIKLYFLSEVLFLLLSKTASAQKLDNIIEITPSSAEVTSQLHRKWFANQWEQNSCTANMAYLDLIPSGSDQLSIFPEAIRELGEKLTDKIFFVPEGELPYKIRSLPSIQWARKLCNLAVLCSWCQTKNNMKHAPNHLINRIGITTDEIHKINEFSIKQARPDRVFDVTCEGVSIKNPSITIQLRHTINYIANEISDNKLNNEIGMFFEKKCIFNYFLRDNIKKNYRVFEGFVPHDISDKDLNPDVDLIIEDIERNQYYFAQVKYLRTGGRAYILGDTDHLVSDKLYKGLRQLTDARLALKAGKLDKILEEKGILNCTNENSHLLLIHNIFNFDFTVWPQGVISYEWNTFRNILNNGSVRFGHSQGPLNTWQNAQVLPFEDPDALINHYIKNSPSAISCSIGTIFDTDNVVVSTEINGTEIRCRGLGL